MSLASVAYRAITNVIKIVLAKNIALSVEV